MADTTLFQAAVRRVGLRRAGQVMAFMVAWEAARQELGRSPANVEEYAEHWRQPVRSAYRELARFRETFPAETTPDRLLDQALAQRVGSLGQLRVA